MGVMERRTTPQIKQKFSDLYTPALITNWQVWPIAQLINFRFMPLPYRVPFQSTCGVFWTLYLSIINSKYVSFPVIHFECVFSCFLSVALQGGYETRPRA